VVFAPGGLVLKLALVVASWVAALAAWAGIVWVACWFAPGGETSGFFRPAEVEGQ
jgi:hypothetical protein